MKKGKNDLYAGSWRRTARWMRRSSAPLVAGLVALGVGVEAMGADPNWMAVPTYVTADLKAGFLPDPWTQSLQAGGGDRVDSQLGPGCIGYIHGAAPDVDLNYEPGSASLYIHATSHADTTLVVNAPDGRWYCNDDFIGLDPMVVFQRPQRGNYNIWVGVHGSSSMQSATLKITELNPAN